MKTHAKKGKHTANEYPNQQKSLLMVRGEENNRTRRRIPGDAKMLTHI
jgi:hypothetical protein